MSRIYVVTTSINGKYPAPVGDATTTSVRLVKADNPAQARNFAVKDSVSVKYAEQQDLVDLMALGAKVEDATDPNAAQPTLPNV